MLPRLETFETEYRNAASSTKRRLLDGLRQDLESKTVLFRGVVWSMSEVTISQSIQGLPSRGTKVFGWEYGGMIVRADVQVGEPPAPVDRIRHRLGGTDVATLVIVRDGTRQIYAFSSNPPLIDRLRIGLDIEVAVKISGMNEESLFGFLEDVGAPPSILRCSHGRQFPSESGFRFCPFCGEALVPETSTSSTQTE